MNNKLQAKDLINIGLFTVLYFVLGCCVAIPIGFVCPYSCPFSVRSGHSLRASRSCSSLSASKNSAW